MKNDELKIIDSKINVRRKLIKDTGGYADDKLMITVETKRTDAKNWCQTLAAKRKI